MRLRRLLILCGLLPVVALGLRGSSPAPRVAVLRLVPSTSATVLVAAADDSASGGTKSWTNPTQAQSNDGLFATVSLDDSELSHYLKLTNPSGISIPAGATINGIRFDVFAKASHNTTGLNGQAVSDQAVHVIKGGTVNTVQNKATYTWQTSLTDDSYGSSADLWGVSWASTDFGSGFGIAIAATGSDPGTIGPTTGSIDYATATISYTPVAGQRRRIVVILS